MIIIAYILVFVFAFLFGGGIGLIVQFGLLFIMGKIIGMPQMMMNLSRNLLIGSYWGGVINGFFAYHIGTTVLGWFSSVYWNPITLGIALLMLFLIPLANKLLNKDKAQNQANPLMQQFQQMQGMFGPQAAADAPSSIINKGSIVSFIGKVVGLGIAILFATLLNTM